MADQRVIVKRLSSVETLGSASVVCSDKSGNADDERDDRPAGDDSAPGRHEVTGVGYAPVGSVVAEHGGRAALVAPQLAENIAVLSGGSLASNADLQQRDGELADPRRPDRGRLPGRRAKAGRHRAARAAVRTGWQRSRSPPSASCMSTDRERSRARRLAGADHQGRPGCAARTLHPGPDRNRCRRADRRDPAADPGRCRPSSPRTRCARWRWPTDRSSTGETAEPSEDLERDLIFVGTVGIIDPPRPEAAVAIAEAHRAGIRVMMITGDHPQTAVRIAADLGIVEPGAVALTGLELDRLDDRCLGRGRTRDLGLRPGGAQAQTADRRRPAGRREDRRHDRRRGQRRAGPRRRRHRHRHGRDRHRSHQGGGQHDPG